MQRYKTKLREFVPDADYFNLIILKFKTFICNTDSVLILIIFAYVEAIRTEGEAPS